MYEEHWGLRESPFRGSQGSKAFYSSPTHEEALARLQFLVDEHRRLGLLAGPSGSGKSLLLDVFAEQLKHNSIPTARLSLLGLDPTEMLWEVATGWGRSLNGSESLGALWRTVSDRLIECRYQQLEIVALFDDADQAHPAVLEHVARLARLDASSETRLTIVLAARNNAIERLGDRLPDWIDLRIDIDLWEPTDTEEYVAARLAQAGRQSPIFAKTAVKRLHELSHGVPRRVSQLADLALLAGAGQALQQIDAGVIDAVCQEFGVAST